MTDLFNPLCGYGKRGDLSVHENRDSEGDLQVVQQSWTLREGVALPIFMIFADIPQRRLTAVKRGLKNTGSSYASVKKASKYK